MAATAKAPGRIGRPPRVTVPLDGPATHQAALTIAGLEWSMKLGPDASRRSANAWRRMHNAVTKWTDEKGPLMTVEQWDEVAEAAKFRLWVEDDSMLVPAVKSRVRV